MMASISSRNSRVIISGVKGFRMEAYDLRVRGLSLRCLLGICSLLLMFSVSAQGESLEETSSGFPATPSLAVADLTCHSMAHAVGRKAFRDAGGDIGKAIRSCTADCHSGCMHGVIEEAFRLEKSASPRHATSEDLRAQIGSVCATQNLPGRTPQTLLECEHGIGHALLAALDYHIHDALPLCDLLPRSVDRSSCYGGIFMENVTAADPRDRDLRLDDPLHPCTMVADPYKKACFADQSRAMLFLGMSDTAVAERCASLAEYGDACFRGFGRDVSLSVRAGNPMRTVTACQVLADGYFEPCIEGAVDALITHTGGGGEWAWTLCAALADSGDQSICLEHAVSFLRQRYAMTNRDLRKECDAQKDSARAACVSALRPRDFLGRMLFWTANVLRK